MQLKGAACITWHLRKRDRAIKTFFLTMIRKTSITELASTRYGGRNNERFQGARRIRDMLDHRIAISNGQSLCNLWSHLSHAIFGQVLNMFAQVPIEMS